MDDFFHVSPVLFGAGLTTRPECLTEGLPRRRKPRLQSICALRARSGGRRPAVGHSGGVRRPAPNNGAVVSPGFKAFVLSEHGLEEGDLRSGTRAGSGDPRPTMALVVSPGFKAFVLSERGPEEGDLRSGTRAGSGDPRPTMAVS